MNCVIYARVSTLEQAERELSIPAQQQAMREYAARQGWQVIEEFLEPGASARTAERPVLQRLLARCRQLPKVDVVLVHKIDRLARNVFDHATIRALLKQRNIRLASVVENVDDTVSGQLVENIMASIAQFYASNLGEEVKKGMRVMVQRGEWPHLPPRGYAHTRTDKGRPLAVPDALAAPAIRRSFERYATGLYSLQRISEELKTEGVTTSRGNPIPISYIDAMLRNPFYIGRIRWNGLEYPGQHEPIVPEELFRQVQKVMRRKKRHPGERGRLKFLLRGLAVCGDCGHLVTAERHGRWAYYRCLRNARGGHCRARFSNARVAHDSLESTYRQLRLSSEVRSWMLEIAVRDITKDAVDSTRRANSLRMRRTKLLERLARLADGFASGDISPEVYRGLHAKLQAERDGLDKALTSTPTSTRERIDRVERVLNVAASLADLHQRLSADGRKHLLYAVFRQIILDEGAIVGYTLKPPFDTLLHGAQRPPSTGSPRTELAPFSSTHLEMTQVTPAKNVILEPRILRGLFVVFDASGPKGLTGYEPTRGFPSCP